MKISKLLPFIALAMFAAFLSSCGDKDSDAVIEVPDPITAGQITPSSFSAKVTGTFIDINKADIALGKHGVLYCPKTDKAAQIFQSWKNGNDTPDCSISGKGTFAGDSYTCTISDLCPETEYSYCLFLQNMDNSAREISAVGTFTTTAFNPGFEALKFENIHFIDAEAIVSATMSTIDAAGCTIGVMLSQTSGFDASNAQLIFDYTGNFGRRMVVKATGVKPDSTYYCRPFARYKTLSGADAYAYGQEGSFSTMTTSQLAVDLGLPSGIMWAKCDLGDYKFSVSPYAAPYFYWGSMQEIVAVFNEDEGYREYVYPEDEHYDKATNTYADLGTEISGTRYDVAHQRLGGKWRLPTLADVEELIANTKQTARNTTYRDYIISGGERYDYDVETYVHDLTGPSKNSISFRRYEDYWCGTASTDDPSYSYPYGFYFSNGSGGNTIWLGRYGRLSSCKVRPVWDTNM